MSQNNNDFVTLSVTKGLVANPYVILRNEVTKYLAANLHLFEILRIRSE